MLIPAEDFANKKEIQAVKKNNYKTIIMSQEMKTQSEEIK
jgi:hypothetical protein